MYKKAMAIMVGAYLFLFLLYFLKMEIESRQDVLPEKASDYHSQECMGIVRYSSSNERIVDCISIMPVQQKEKTQDKESQDKEAIMQSEGYRFPKEEIEVLERIVEAEAGGEDEEGKLLVANVVLNRVNSDDFPDTISEVVFQCSNGVTQFSPVRNGRYESVVVSEETQKAVGRALQGEDVSEGALYFAARKYANQKSMRWFDEKLSFLFKHGGHEFFK